MRKFGVAVLLTGSIAAFPQARAQEADPAVLLPEDGGVAGELQILPAVEVDPGAELPESDPGEVVASPPDELVDPAIDDSDPNGGTGEEYVDGDTGEEYVDDGTGEEYVDEDTGEEYVDDGTGEEYVDDGTGEEYVDEDTGEEYVDDGTGEEYVDDGTGEEYVDDGTGEEYVDDGTGEEYVDDGTGEEYVDGDTGEEYVDDGTGEEYVDEDTGSGYVRGDTGGGEPTDGGIIDTTVIREDQIYTVTGQPLDPAQPDIKMPDAPSGEVLPVDVVHTAVGGGAGPLAPGGAPEATLAPAPAGAALQRAGIDDTVGVDALPAGFPEPMDVLDSDGAYTPR